jgi:hypothetical protein
MREEKFQVPINGAGITFHVGTIRDLYDFRTSRALVSWCAFRCHGFFPTAQIHPLVRSSIT